MVSDHISYYRAVVSLVVLFRHVLSHIISSSIISHCIVIQGDIIIIPGIWLPNKLIFDFKVHHVTVCAFAVGCRRYLVSSLPDTRGLQCHLTLSNQISQRAAFPETGVLMMIQRPTF